ncbi:glycosyltransferase [Vibrio methylphosphonaticus]|uniref:glycosyltransferase n=1 Tax=Vibrio methylphosphonaticus TaxID=2946866 RepID=UPI002029F8A2|nr:glycosyltransferase [Vibrio methylphosphonaticus]MCL9775461.1 glycosyltransferase [Vibrio methylphosphonaticus]
MKKKLLFMQPEFCMGGVERVLLTLLKNINFNKYDVTVLLRNEGIWDEEIPNEVNVRYIFKKSPRKQGKVISRLYKYGLMLIPGAMLSRLLRLNEYDVVISFHEPMMYFLKGVKGKKVAWIHTDFAVVDMFPEIKELKNKEGIIARFISYTRLNIFQQCDQIVCVAKSARKGLINKTKIPPSKVAYKYNLNDETRIRELSLERVPFIDGSEFNICSVGRLVEQKAFHRLVYLAEKLMEDGLKFKIYVVGDGPQESKLNELINRKGLKETIKLVGYDSNPYKYIASCDLFVCSSLYEAFCTATTESIILGTPLVTTECSGMEELIGNTKAGLIVENSEDSLYRGVKSVLVDEILLSEMTKAARDRGKQFETSRLISEIERVFDY